MPTVKGEPGGVKTKDANVSFFTVTGRCRALHICFWFVGGAEEVFSPPSVVLRVTTSWVFDCCVLCFDQTATPTRGPPDRVKSYLLVLFATRTSPYGVRQAIQWSKPAPGRTFGREWRVVYCKRFHARRNR